MKKAILLCVACLMTMVTTLAVAQSDKGTITMEIVDVTSDNQQVAAQLQMMKGTQLNVYYKGQVSVTSMNMMGGMVVTNVKMSEKGDMDMLMTMMGQKIWVQASKAEQDRARAENANAMTDLDIEYDESDTKNIAGFDCYKMIVTSPDNEGFKLEAYITPKLKINAAMIQNVDISEFRGVPLEYIISSAVPGMGGSMNMVFSTTNYSNDVDDAMLQLNTDGFTKMTLQEFMSSMGGAMGF